MQARKAAQAQNSSHVYTNDDLQRSRILVDSDSASVETRKKDSTGPHSTPTVASQSAATGDAGNVSGTESLGEVARRYRREKAARETDSASRIPMTSPFHMDVPQPALAEVSPRSALLSPSSPLPAKSIKPGVSGVVENGTLRRDPFARPVIGSAEQSGELPAAAFLKSRRPKLVSPKVVESRPAEPRPTHAPVMTPPSAAPRAMATVAAVNNGTSSHAAVTVTPGESRRMVTVRVGDSLWNLSREYSGNGTRWREWLVSNPRVADPRRLRAGVRLVVPRTEDRSAVVPPSMTRPSGQTVVVRTGDSLWKIAAAHYGRGASWPCVAQENPDVRDSDRIYPGQEITLPAACAAADSSLAPSFTAGS